MSDNDISLDLAIEVKTTRALTADELGIDAAALPGGILVEGTVLAVAGDPYGVCSPGGVPVAVSDGFYFEVPKTALVAVL